MKDTDLKRIIENMQNAGCSPEDTERVRMLYQAGFDSEAIHCIRKCRCMLIDDLHDVQRKVDRIDSLIRMAENL